MIKKKHHKSNHRPFIVYFEDFIKISGRQEKIAAIITSLNSGVKKKIQRTEKLLLKAYRDGLPDHYFPKYIALPKLCLIIHRSNLNLNIYLIHQMFHAIIALVIFVVIKTIVAIIAIAVLGGRVAQRPR